MNPNNKDLHQGLQQCLDVPSCPLSLFLFSLVFSVLIKDLTSFELPVSNNEECAFFCFWIFWFIKMFCFVLRFLLIVAAYIIDFSLIFLVLKAFNGINFPRWLDLNVSQIFQHFSLLTFSRNIFPFFFSSWTIYSLEVCCPTFTYLEVSLHLIVIDIVVKFTVVKENTL